MEKWFMLAPCDKCISGCVDNSDVAKDRLLPTWQIYAIL